MSCLSRPLLHVTQEVYKNLGFDPNGPEVFRIADEIENWIRGKVIFQMHETILCRSCDRVVAVLLDETGPNTDLPDFGLPRSDDAPASANSRSVLEEAREEVEWAERRARFETQADAELYVYDFCQSVHDSVRTALFEEAGWNLRDLEDESRIDFVQELCAGLLESLIPWIEFTLLRQLVVHLCPACQAAFKEVWYGERMVEARDEDGEEESG